MRLGPIRLLDVMVRLAARRDCMHGTDEPDAPGLPVPAGDAPGPAMREAARRYVRDAEPLAAFLADLEVAYRVLDLPPPSTETVKEASIAWADEFLRKLDGVTCEDPLTGMSGPEHARAYLSALVRTEQERCTDPPLQTHAVVSVVLAEPEAAVQDENELETAFDRSLQLATVGETIRATFERCDVVSALGPRRVLAVVGRDQFLDNRAEELDWLLRRRLPVSSAPRVQVRSMPRDEDQTDALLAEPRT